MAALLRFARIFKEPIKNVVSRLLQNFGFRQFTGIIELTVRMFAFTHFHFHSVSHCFCGAVRVFRTPRRVRPSHGYFFLTVFQGNCARGRTGHMINCSIFSIHKSSQLLKISLQSNLTGAFKSFRKRDGSFNKNKLLTQCRTLGSSLQCESSR